MLTRSLTVTIAQADSRLERFASGFQRDRAQFDAGDVVLFVTGCILVLAVLILVARWSERRVRGDSSLALFLSLAKTHAVSWSDRWLLWRIAREKGVAEPAVLFLDPRLTSPQLLGHLAPQVAARLKTLRRRFFFGIDQNTDPPSFVPETEGQVDRPGSSAGDGGEVAPEEGTARLQPTGDLADALGAIRTLQLKEQLVDHRQPPETPEPAEQAEGETPKSSGSADFPAPDAPVLDLYPWLSNDWEIGDADQGQPPR